MVWQAKRRLPAAAAPASRDGAADGQTAAPAAQPPVVRKSRRVGMMIGFTTPAVPPLCHIDMIRDRK
jgi:hypothetical protein